MGYEYTGRIRLNVGQMEQLLSCLAQLGYERLAPSTSRRFSLRFPIERAGREDWAEDGSLTGLPNEVLVLVHSSGSPAFLSAIQSCLAAQGLKVAFEEC